MNFNDYWAQSRGATLPESTAYFLKQHVRDAWNAGRDTGRAETKAEKKKQQPVTFGADQ